MNPANHMILRPVITEKSLKQAAVGVYTFIVPMTANKLTIAEAVSRLFKVDAINVRIMVQRGKLKSYKQIKGRRSDYKKAFVQIKAGQKIVAFDLGQDESVDKNAKKDKPADKKTDAKKLVKAGVK